MSVWFKNPDLDTVGCLSYSFWLIEGYSCLNSNTLRSLRDDSKWDLRFWLSMVVTPFIYVLVPLLCLSLKGRALNSIHYREGFSVSNTTNIEVFTLLNDVFKDAEQQIKDSKAGGE